MPSNDDRKITMDEIKALLEKPPLIRGESEEAFWKWFSAFADEYQPESFSDWLEVHDYAVKQWEQNRLQRSNSALVEGVQYRALRNLVMPFFTLLNSVRLDYGCRSSTTFFSEMTKRRNKRATIFEAFEITDDQILAEAMQIRAKELVAFDRIDNYRANAAARPS